MAVKIRLTRMGDKKSPFYRMVATDTRAARNSTCIENLGTYNPLVTPVQIKLNRERIQYWLSVGAQVSDTARELLVKQEILTKKPYRAPKAKQMPPVKQEVPEAEAPVEVVADVLPEAPAEEVVEQPAVEVVEQSAEVPVEENKEKPAE